MNRVLFSRKSDHWATPDAVYAALDAEFHFTFDPCPLRSEIDSLKTKWEGRMFCNPPYSNIAAFMARGLHYRGMGLITAMVFLVPARTDTRWFHEHVLPEAEIRFIKGRLKFGGAKNSAPFPSMICVWS